MSTIFVSKTEEKKKPPWSTQRPRGAVEGVKLVKRVGGEKSTPVFWGLCLKLFLKYDYCSRPSLTLSLCKQSRDKNGDEKGSPVDENSVNFAKVSEKGVLLKGI